MPAGFFHTLPIIGAMFMGGTTQDGEPMMIITSENPERVRGFDAELAKEVLERFHLECFVPTTSCRSVSPRSAMCRAGVAIVLTSSSTSETAEPGSTAPHWLTIDGDWVSD